MSVNLLTDPVDSSLRAFAIPMAFSFLVNIIYSLIDRYYVSRIGDAAIAAIGVSDQVAFFVFTLASGFGVGTGIIVARRFGEGNRDAAAATATQAIATMVLIAGTITAGLYAALPYLPTLMKMPPAAAPLAIDFMGALFIGFTANLVNFQIFAILRSTGNAVFPMVALIFTTVVNAALAPFLIFGLAGLPALGIKGAGMATATAQILGCCLSLWAITTGRTNLRLRFTGFRFDGDTILRIARQGVPASLQMLSVSMNRLLVFNMVGAFGTSVTAAYTLGLTVDMVVFMCVFAIAMAVEVATGQNLGAGNRERIFLYHRSAVKQITVVLAVLGVAVWLGGASFIAQYTESAVTRAEGLRYLHTSVFGYLFFAIGVITVRVMSGAGASFMSMFITAGSLLLIQVPIAYGMSHWMGLEQHGIWIGNVVGYAIYAAIALIVLRSQIWLNRKV